MRVKKHGFTLVELLVVIAIIGVLVALLLPAVQAAREAARRMQCSNHLKQIGLGLQNYHDVYLSLPYGARARRIAGTTPTTGNVAGPSWYVGILPFCEQKNLSDLIEQRALNTTNAHADYNSIANNANKIAHAAHNQKIPWMLCPSSPLPQTETLSSVILTTPSYVGISGAWTGSTSSTPPTAGNSTGATGEKVFDEKRVKQGVAGVGRWSGGGLLIPNESLNMAAAIDGTSQTMIASEVSDYFWHQDTATKTGTRTRVDGSATGSAVGNQTGGRWFVGTASNAKIPSSGNYGDIFNLVTVSHYTISSAVSYVGVNGKKQNLSWNTQGIRGSGPNKPLLSAHPNVVLAVFMDGHVQTLAKQTHPAIVKRLATRDDGQQIADF